MQSSLQARCCQCSLSSIRIYHSLAHSGLVALSFTIKTGYWEVVERSLPPCALRRDVWGLSCCRSNLAHKRRCLLAVSPVTVQWWNNPLILCYLSGRSWVLTEAPNPFWLAEHILSWVVVEQEQIYWPEGWWGGVGGLLRYTAVDIWPKYTLHLLSTHVNVMIAACKYCLILRMCSLSNCMRSCK